jgi:FimV-like protein
MSTLAWHAQPPLTTLANAEGRAASASALPLRAPVNITPPYTLWRLCTELTQHQPFDRYQLLVAIEARNPRAFVQHNVHKILPAQQLVLPSAQQVLMVDAQLAKQRVEADEALHRQRGDAATWLGIQLQSRQQVLLAWQTLTRAETAQTSPEGQDISAQINSNAAPLVVPSMEKTMATASAEVSEPDIASSAVTTNATASREDSTRSAGNDGEDKISEVEISEVGSVHVESGEVGSVHVESGEATGVTDTASKAVASPSAATTIGHAAPDSAASAFDESSLASSVSDDAQNLDASSHRFEQQVGAFWRQYLQPGRVGQAQQQPRLTWQAELSWQSADDAQQLVIVPYLRWDGLDSAQHLADLRQAYWSWAGAGIELKAGVDKVFWGVTESQHLVDIINQTDMVARPDGEEKLGQPLLQMNYSGRLGTFQAYLLPYFRPREFAAADGRIRAPLPIIETPRYPDPLQNRFVHDYALRFYQQFDSLDIAISWFDGTAREPLLRPEASNSSQLEAFYPQLQQLGLELQWLQGSWLWKLEAVERRQLASQYQAWVGGVEYSHIDAFSTGYDLGWLLEYQYDSRQLAVTTPASRDLFAGLRVAFNDTESSELLVGLLQDVEFSQEQSLYLEGSTRLNDNMRLRVEAWLWRSYDMQQPLWWVAQDDYLQLGLDWYF